VVTFLLTFPPKPCTHPISPRASYMHRPLHSPTVLFYLYLAKSTRYGAPHYAAFSSLLLLNPSSAQIFPSATCSQIPLVYIQSIMSENQFHTHTKTTSKIIVLYILIFTFLDSRQEDERFWTDLQGIHPVVFITVYMFFGIPVKHNNQ
jgi:hypothetical protein